MRILGVHRSVNADERAGHRSIDSLDGVAEGMG
jgi:hypothetical protein